MLGIPDEELVVFEDELDQLFVYLFDQFGQDDAEEELRVGCCDLFENFLYEGALFF